MVLALTAIVVVADRYRVLLFRAPVDTQPFLAALGHAIEDGDVDEARTLAESARPAWVPDLVLVALGGDAGDALERATDLKFEATHRLYALRVFARLGTAMGFLGALIELIWLISGDHGLLALQAGLVERIAMERAVLAMLVGVGISVFSLVALSILKKAASQLIRDLSQTLDLLEAHGYGMEAPLL